MKKFLTFSIIIFVILLGIGKGIIKSGEVKNQMFILSKVEGKDILINQKGKWEKFNIKGINMDPSKPGSFPGDSDVSKEEYLNWITKIYDMNINTIRVSNLMPKNFYLALDEFNNKRENPIYLIQGIYFDEVKLKNGYDPNSPNMIKMYKKQIKLIVDSVHGDPYNLNKLNILDRYDVDVSQYVLAYTLGGEWAKRDVIYSEIMNDNNYYKGKYFSTAKGASSFEAYLAKMADYLVEYEKEKFQKETLITVVATPAHIINHKLALRNEDIVISDRNRIRSKMKNYIEIENIKPTENLNTGIFASYNVFSSYIENNYFKGNIKDYFETINEYHNIPVVISEYGIPSSRVKVDSINTYNTEYINEKEQGEQLVRMYKAINEAKCAGSIMYEWQDCWYKSTWNTKDEVILDRSAYWNNAQTYNQGFGLLAFDPGKEGSVSYPDESNKEWTEEDILNKNEEYSLSMKSDEKYLYFMVQAKNPIDFNKDRIYIDLDVTPKSGSNKSSEYGLTFDRPVDFIIDLNGKDNSRILVQEFYDTHEFLENTGLYKIRPDIINHNSSKDKFSPIYIFLRPRTFIEPEGKFLDPISYETGKLIYGNGNPKSDQFNSVSDFYFKDNYVEVRTPWALLNFMDPSTKQIESDFYNILGIRALDIDEIYVGVTIKEKYENQEKPLSRLNSAKYDLDGWINPTYHERLKESYYIVKEALKE